MYIMKVFIKIFTQKLEKYKFFWGYPLLGTET